MGKVRDNSNTNNCMNIPYDICTEILLRLPVRSLVPLTKVSKEWCFMISFDFDFIRSHFLRTQQNPQFKHFIKIVGSYQNYVSIDHDRFGLTFLNSPSRAVKTRLEILASYNGLLLLGNGDTDHYLWNPTTMSSKKLGGNFHHFRDCIRMYGFGYDSSCNAYKVIRIVRVTSSENDVFSTFDPILMRYHAYDSTQVKIYNSRTNSWKRVVEFPYVIFQNQQGVVVNGAPHWIVARPEISEFVIIYFDLVKERFKEVESPFWLLFDTEFRLGVWNGFLCLVRDENVWVMKEHGVKETWTELTTAEKSKLEVTMDFVIYIQPTCSHHKKIVFDRAWYVESPISPHIGSDDVVSSTVD